MMDPGDPNPAGADRAPGGRLWQIRRHRLIAIGVAVVLLSGSVVAALELSSAKGTTRVAVAPTTTTTTTTVPRTPPALPHSGPFTVATSKVDQLRIYGQPNTADPPIATLPAKTAYGITTTLLTDPDVANPVSGWVLVTVPLHRPNDTEGWVQESDVTLTQTSYAINISLSQHTLVLLNAGHPVLSTQIIIGAPQTPTPTGRFFLTDPINCNTVSVPGYPVAQCSSVYGAFAIGTSGLSDALDSFDGTIPQIALHGTDLPVSQLGTNQSNGCVRMPNDMIIQIARITPLLGTPVTITA
jgi:lipoprotein-anchoring transpeptidase ErfK/SrfK